MIRLSTFTKNTEANQKTFIAQGHELLIHNYQENATTTYSKAWLDVKECLVTL